MNHEHASFKNRTIAFSIDLGIIGAAQLILGGMTLEAYKYICIQFGSVADYDTSLILSQFCGGFFFISYFTFSVGVFGNTAGKEIMKLKVIYESDGVSTHPTLRQAYWRSMAYLMSSWTYMIGFILPWFRKDKLALHDLVCGSRVVQQAPIEASNEQQLELPFLAPVLKMRIPTKGQAPSPGRTGTDP